ncbi:MAG: M6 family metalloprotease domain-containing protein [Paludibacteraceae bacterium]|nr:M6 family metalloprotease domain-containing protein [Paludibacteraceae bacterium]
MIKKILSIATLVVMLVIPMQLNAIKAYPHAVEVKQPDGKTITVKLNGDEFRRYYTTEDGYALHKNARGYFVYSAITTEEVVARNPSARTLREITLLENIREANTAVIQRQKAAGSVNPRAKAMNAIQAGFPLNGSPKTLVILVNFSDKSFVVPDVQTAFNNLLNQSGYSANGATGSAKDYFMASSYGQFAPQFDVVGPYNLPKTMDAYGANVDGWDVDPARMVVDACKAADAAGLDFSQYDTDDDGVVDNVFVYYAGFNEAEGAELTTIWPHRWVVYTSEESASDYSFEGTVAEVTFDEKRVFDYACTSELKGLSGSNMCGIGTFCHEFGHVLGLPDYYHTKDDKNTLNNWSIMDAGGYLNQGRTPPVYSSYDRFFLGWSTPQQISMPSDNTLLPLSQGTTPPVSTAQQSYLLSAANHNLLGNDPNPKEFFMLEYRKKTGWDAYIPKEGMLIWHIDYDQSAWDDNTPNNYTGSTQTASSHMRVYLQPLSGSTSTPGTAFTSGSFTPTTWSGTAINRAITGITKSDESMSFKLMGGAPQPGITIAGSVNNFGTVTGTPSAIQSVVVSGAMLTNVITINFSNDDHFEMKLSSASEWSKTLVITPVSGSVSETLQIRYNPANAGTHNSELTLSSVGVATKIISVAGTSTAPVIPGVPYVAVGVVGSELTLGPTKLNGTNTKLLNVKTTDLSGSLTIAVTGANASMFTVSSSSVSKDNANALGGTNINIVYKPTSAGSHSATLTISGGGLNPAKVIQLSGTGN